MFQLCPLIFIALVLYYNYIQFSRRKWPPGPFPYPLVGNIIQVRNENADLPIAFANMAKKYGSIFSVKMGIVPIVIVNGYKAVKEMNSLDTFMDRFDDDWCLDRCFGSRKNGLFFSTTNSWRDNRRFTQLSLKHVGFGKANAMGDLLEDEFKILCDRVRKISQAQNGVFKTHLAFNCAFVNILYSFVAGVRFPQNDPKLHQLVKLSNEWFDATNIGNGLLSFYPFLQYYAPEFCGFERIHRSNVKLQAYFTELIEGFRKRGDYKSNPSNFIDLFLQRIDAGPSQEDYEEPIFTDKNLVSLLMDIFSAGSDSSAFTLAFTVRHFVHNPQIQMKVQQEIERVVGIDRSVKLEDKPRLKYTEAVILEVLRYNTLSPFVPRLTADIAQIRGYEIPKGTHVMPNLHSANHDDSIWEHPEVFLPERFLDNNGNITNSDKLLTFSSGKRNCIGDTVAKASIFMGVCAFAQNFTFEVDPTFGPPGFGHTDDLTIGPLPFSVKVKCRY